PGAGALPGTPSATTAPTPTSSPTATAALPDRLAYTGAEVGTATAAAGVLLGLGGLLTVLRRRLRRS
ncbi:LPXTG cell wall anchor domain-containing protein, partial [Curtobacterium sp. APC 4022]|uniref:LPXTG cell wall anchor domain-containing protein n=1 Tax=Curtobacterium sp. APC 4022 TaxID=3035201 RepID=UPI0025B299F1